MKRIILSCITLLLILLPVAFIFGCQQKAPSSTPTPSPASTTPASITSPTIKPTIASKTYTNSEHGFSVEYLADWDFEEGIYETIVFFAGPIIKETGGMISINIVKEELPDSPKVTLDDYNKLGELHLKKSVENYQNLKEHDAVISGVPAILRTYSFDLEGNTFQGTQALFIKNNTAYVITYTATSNSYSDNSGEYDLVINSFKFK